MVIFLIPLLQWAVALWGTAYSAKTDYEDKKIYDGTTLTMMGIGLILLLFSWNLLPILFAVIVLGIGKLANQRGLMGGGDVKLLIGIQLLVPWIYGIPSSLFVVAIGSLMFLVFSLLQPDKKITHARFGIWAFVALIFGGLIEWVFVI